MKKPKPIKRISANIYQDHNNRVFYYQSKDQTAFYINNRLSGLIEILHNRLISSLLITAGLYAFFNGELQYYFPILLLVYAALELAYRRILSTSDAITPYPLPEVIHTVGTSNTKDKNELIKKSVVFAILGIGLIISAILESNQGIILYLVIGIAAFSLFQSILNLYWLIKQKN